MDQLEEIKSKINLVDFIQGYFPLKKAGRNFKALCPFHTEKTPSFMVSPERQIWHCFGCGAGGDIFGFLMQIEHLDFSEALQVLAQRTGVTLERFKPELKEKKNHFFEANRLACLFYHKILTSTPAGKPALEYLIKKRTLPQATIEEFQLGYAPSTAKSALLNLLIKKGFSEDELKELGLVKEIEGRSYDFFRNRIIFPFFDNLGRIIGFTARALNPKDEPKYLNSPQNLIFDKGKTLYGFWQGKDSLKEKNEIILVEGQMDVLASHKVGLKNVVSSSGTALTSSQIKLIKKYTPNLILAFDMDVAGDSATKRGIEEAVEEGLAIKVALLPFGKDPDECIKKDPSGFKKAIKGAIYFVDFYFRSISSKIKVETLEGKKEAISLILPILAKISDKVEAGFWISRLSSLLKIKEKIIADCLSTFRETPLPPSSEEISLSSSRRLIEERLLGLIFTFPSYISEVISHLKPEDFDSPKLASLWKSCQIFFSSQENPSFKKFKESLSGEEQEKINILTLGVEHFYQDKEEEEILAEIHSYCDRLSTLRLEEERQALEFEIRQAEEIGDKEKVKKLVLKFQKLISQKDSS